MVPHDPWRHRFVLPPFALQMMEKEDVELMLLDVNLPGISGFEVLKIEGRERDWLPRLVDAAGLAEAVRGRGVRLQGARGYATLLSPLVCSGLKPHFLEKMSANGVALPGNFFEQDNPNRPAFAAASYGS